MPCNSNNSNQWIKDNLFPINNTNAISAQDLQSFVDIIYQELLLKQNIQDDVITADPCKALSSSQGKFLQDTKESSIGNPVVNDYILSSSAGGTRSWVPNIITIATLSDVSTTGAANKDSLVFDSATGNWIPQAIATITENGGIAWSSASTYTQGDIVSEGTSAYISLLSSNLNNQPSTNPGNWAVVPIIISISDLSDVDAVGSTDGDYLKYNGTEYKPSNFDQDSTASIQASVNGQNGIKVTPNVTGVNVEIDSSLNDLNDVNTSPVAVAGDQLVFRGSNWVNEAQPSIPVVIKDLTDIDTTGAINGQTLVFNGTLWEPQTPAAASAINDLTDVTTVLAVDGDRLVYNAGVWIPEADIPFVEKGGVAYKNTETYAIGDLVVDNNNAYVCILPGATSLPSITPGEWKNIDVAEVGGRAWSGVNHYQVGDTVTVGNKFYIALRVNPGTSPLLSPSDWIEVNQLTKENKGAVWATGYDYQTGDVVTLNSELYVSIIPSTDISPDSDDGTWRNVNYQEVSGKVWDNLTQYANGDVVTVSTDIYVAKPNPVVGESPTGLGTGDWHLVDFTTNESGGLAWDSGKAYPAGAMVSDNGMTYVAISSVATGGLAPSMAPSGEWASMTDVEIGGRVWDTSKRYENGDIVTKEVSGVSGIQKLYVCNKNTTLAPSVGEDPEIVTVSWTALEIGDIGGRVWDSLTQYQNGDLVTSGQDVYIAMNNPLIGTDPTINPGTWYNSTRYGERGGLVYSAAQTYALGDIVSFSGIVYTSLADNNLGVQPDTTGNTKWIVSRPVEQGGVTFDNTKTYMRGDIISVGSKIWIAMVDNIPGTDPIQDPEWYNASRPEAGGVAWYASTEYHKGDIIYDSSVTSDPELGPGQRTLYLANVTIPVATSAPLNPSPADSVTSGSTDWEVLEIRKQKDISFDSSLNYLTGDIVSVPGQFGAEIDLFVAPSNISSGVAPSVPVPGLWTLVTPNERGGIAWQTNFDYSPGDIVSQGVVNTKPVAWMAVLPVNSSQPGIIAGEWQELDINFNVNTLFDSSRSYEQGDVVTVFVNGKEELFVAPLGGVPSGPWNIANWSQVTVNEIGGVAWQGDAAQPNSKNYVIGDIVSQLVSQANGLLKHELFTCIVNIVADPSNNPPSLDPINWEPIQNDEIAGRSWDNGEYYLDGDVVTLNGIMYTCNTDDLPSTITPDINPNWTATAGVPVERPIPGITKGDLLMWDGSEWIAAENIKYQVTASPGQIAFVITGSTADTADVFVNGALQREGTPATSQDYSISNGTVTLNSGANSGDWVQINTIG